VKYSKEFFEINLRFAQKVAAVLGQPLETVLLDYTHLYLRFGLGRSFDPAHPSWQTYLMGLSQSQDLVQWTYEFYLRQSEQLPPKIPDPNFGCFSYARLDDGRIRIHFHNGEPGDESPLCHERIDVRLSELKAMFAHLKQLVPPTINVLGGSWLYNLEAYRRLFPPRYLESAYPNEDEFQFISLWGQFVDRQGCLRKQPVKLFLDNLQRENTLEGLKASFPFQSLHLENPLKDFYQFYGIE